MTKSTPFKTMNCNAVIHKILYRTLSLDGYLRFVSRMFFVLHALGVGKRSRGMEYAYHLPQLVAKGDTVIDLGANLGYYSRIISHLAGRGGKVFSVEPVKPILEVLRRNLRGCDNVEILNYALGDADRTITMVNDTARLNGYMGTGQNHVCDTGTADSDDDCFEAEMRRGSKLFASIVRLDFIKCDIEGYELVVMREMQPLLERFHPRVLIETGGDNRRQIVELFTSLGYSGFTLDEGREVPLTADSDKDIIFRHQS